MLLELTLYLLIGFACLLVGKATTPKELGHNILYVVFWPYFVLLKICGAYRKSETEQSKALTFHFIIKLNYTETKERTRSKNRWCSFGWYEYLQNLDGAWHHPDFWGQAAVLFTVVSVFLLIVLRMNGITQRSKPQRPALQPANRIIPPRKMSVGL